MEAVSSEGPSCRPICSSSWGSPLGPWSSDGTTPEGAPVGPWPSGGTAPVGRSSVRAASAAAAARRLHPRGAAASSCRVGGCARAASPSRARRPKTAKNDFACDRTRKLEPKRRQVAVGRLKGHPPGPALLCEALPIGQHPPPLLLLPLLPPQPPPPPPPPPSPPSPMCGNRFLHIVCS